MSEILEPRTFGVFDTLAGRRLAAIIESRGDGVFFFTPPEISALTADFSAATVATADWLILLDPLAADFFLDQYQTQGGDFYDLDELTIVAAGEAVADRLRFRQVHADLIPAHREADAILREMTAFAGELAGIECLLAGRLRHASMAGVLTARGAIVHVFDFYDLKSNPANSSRERALLVGGAVDAFVFTSVEDVVAFTSSPVFSDLDLPSMLATDEVTFQMLREEDFRPLYFK